MKTLHFRLFIITALMLCLAGTAFPQGTAFTYHGRLNDNGIPASGSYDLTFAVFDAPNVGHQVGSPLTNTPVGVTNGLFTAVLDFGPGIFTGPDRWLEMGVRTNGAGDFTALNPRQRLTPTPYAIMAGSASNLLGTLSADQLSGTMAEARLSTNVALLNGSPTFSGNVTILGDLLAARLNVGLNSTLGTLYNTSLYATIGGGANNSIPAANYGTIAGGMGNTMGFDSPWEVAQYSAIGGGIDNTVKAPIATIGGGSGNQIFGGGFRGDSGATIGGGRGNILSGSAFATVAGGDGNVMDGLCGWGTIGGGQSNINSGRWSTIGGGAGNNIFGDCDFGYGDRYGTIAGGVGNRIFAYHSVSCSIGGGSGNTITDLTFSGVSGGVIGGGSDNSVKASYGTIAGGLANLASGPGSFIGGGGWDGSSSGGNQATGAVSTISGGLNNLAGDYSTIGGGASNVSIGNYAVVGGGYTNTSSGAGATVAGGAGNSVNGEFGMIPGGLRNVATTFGFAAGRRAKALHTGSFVWGDSTDADVESSANNQLTIRAAGGVRFLPDANASNSVELAPGSGAWASLSDRNVKRAFSPVEPRAILGQLARMPIQTWGYKAQDASVRHIGPTAQDFHAAFNVGENERHISTVDADGVALAAIKGLNEKLEEAMKAKDTRITELEKRLEKLESVLLRNTQAAQ